ncbi:MAG: hypothetical protein V1816_15420 [Pseudomonadota bacterium]
MNPVTVFLIRFVASLGAAYFVARFYFDGAGWSVVFTLAAFMLLVAYVFEALRRKGGADKGQG